jgi:peptidoglycan/xylan/chitin deacetylase (PgdA/CDA1 family)
MSFSVFCMDILGKHVQRHFNPDKRAGILYFHRVLESSDIFYPGDITKRELRNLIRCLNRIFDIVPLTDIQNKAGINAKPKLAITFDDGYRDNLLYGLPVLEEFGVPATLFVATAGIETGILWQDVVLHCVKHAHKSSLLSYMYIGDGDFTAYNRFNLGQKLISTWKYLSLPRRDSAVEGLMKICGFSKEDLPRLMLSKEDISSLDKSPLISIGAHTHNHAILTTLTESQAMDEIKDSLDILSDITGNQVSLFGYPNGKFGSDYLPVHANMLKKLGVEMAFSTMDGGVDRCTSRFHVPRFLPYRKASWMRALATMKVAGEVA